MEKYLNVYFGSQTDYYSAMYKQYLNGKKFTFNFVSFLLVPYWFLYRKLYLHGLLLFVFIAIIEQVEALLFKKLAVADQNQLIIHYSISMVLSIFAGFMGNYLYIKKMEKNLEEVFVSTDDEEQRMELIYKKGGTWFGAYVLGGLLLIVLAFIIRK